MLAALLALALAHSAATTPPPARETAVAAARAAVAGHKLGRYHATPLRERAAAAGLDRARVARLLTDLADACPDACPDLAREPAVSTLLHIFGESGTAADAPLLLRLEARGSYEAGRALEAILARALADAVARAACAAPTPAELAEARADLRDFLVLRQRGAALVAEAALPAELDDLAYFYAAVAGNGPQVGAAREGSGSWASPAAPDPELDKLAADLTRAQAAGDLPALVAAGRAYLARLGFPGPIRADAEGTWAWGGARFSYVLRDLAQASELLGDHALAGQLYRRADPGGGACGTSTSHRWAEQVRGAIRSAEQLGDCRAALAERLLDIDGPPTMFPQPAPVGEDYGPARLAAAGFDVARLYRGALLTAGRGDEAQLRAALAAAPPALGQPALERLARLGPEHWERRVYAAEGLADVGRRDAIPQLLAALAAAPGDLRPRLLAAIGELARRPEFDPCDPDLSGIGLSGIGSGWTREITWLGGSCDTVLRLGDARVTAVSLVPWLQDHDPDTRAAAAHALGELGHRAALPALRARARDPYLLEGATICEDDRCRPDYPVREAVADAIARIQELSRSDARWQKNDARRP